MTGLRQRAGAAVKGDVQDKDGLAKADSGPPNGNDSGGSGNGSTTSGNKQSGDNHEDAAAELDEAENVNQATDYKRGQRFKKISRLMASPVVGDWLVACANVGLSPVIKFKFYPMLFIAALTILVTHTH